MSFQFESFRLRNLSVNQNQLKICLSVSSVKYLCFQLKQRERLSAAVSGSGANSVVQRTSRWRHDDIPKEKIMKIYKRELALLREQVSFLNFITKILDFSNQIHKLSVVW